MCSKMISILNNLDGKSIKEAKSQIENRTFKNVTSKPIIDLLTYQLSQINQFKGDIGYFKTLLLSVISSFLSSLAQCRQELKVQVLQELNDAKLKNEQLEIQLKAHQKAAQEREPKIATMEQTISDLTEQVTYLKQQKASNARISQLERQLSEKNRQIEEQKEQHDKIIEELEQELEDKTNFLEKYRKSTNEQIYKLETRLDSQLTRLHRSDENADAEIKNLEAQISERDEIIQQHQETSQSQILQLEELLETQKQKSAQLSSQLKSKDSEIFQLKKSITTYESQLTEKSDALTMLEAEKSMSQGAMSIAELEDLKEDTQEKDYEIEQLKSQIQSMNSVSSELDTLRSNYLKKSKEVDELKRTADTAQKNLLDLQNQNRKLTQSYRQLELRLSNGKTNQTSLQNDFDHAIMICQIRKKKIKQLKKENIELRNQITANKEIIEEQSKEISEFKLASVETNLETSYLKQQLSVSKTDYDKNNTIANSLKEKLTNTISILKQKEKMINDMLEMDKQKTSEIEKLSKHIEELQHNSNAIQGKLDLMNKMRTIEQQQSTIKRQEDQLEIANTNLAKSKADCRSLELTTSEQKAKIDILQSQIEDQKETIQQNEKEIHRLLSATTELSNRNSISSLDQTNDNDTSSQIMINKLSRKNSTLTQNIKEHQEKISALNNEIENLETQNHQLKAENTELTQQIKTSIQPLKEENEKLNRKVIKLTAEKQKINESYQNSESLYKEQKLKSQATISVLENKVDQLNQELVKTKKEYNANISQLEDNFESINAKIKGSNMSNAKNLTILQELQKVFAAASYDNIIPRANAKIEECKKINSELQDLKKELENANQVQTEQKKKLELLSSENKQLNNQLTKMNDNSTSFDSEKSELINKIVQLESSIENEKEESETIRACFNELKEEISSMKEVIQFDSLSSLKTKIIEILDSHSKMQKENDQITKTIKTLENQNQKLNKENLDNEALINDQKNTISQLTKSEKDLKKELLQLNKDTNSSSFELQNQLQATQQQIDMMNTSISKLHEIITFSSTDDIYVAISSVINQKNKMISDLQHQLDKSEVTVNDSIIQIDKKTQKIQEQQQEIIELKKEQFDLKCEKQQLEKGNSSLTKSFNELKCEFDQSKISISNIQSQISQIVQYTSFDELPTVIYGLKEEFDLEKQKNELLRRNNEKLSADITRSESKLLEANRQLREIEQEKNGIQSQMKIKEIVDSQIYGVSNIRDLPKKYTELNDNLTTTKQQLDSLTNRCKELSKKVEDSERSLFEATNLNDEYKLKNDVLTTELNKISKENLEIKEKAKTMSNQINDYETKIDQLVNENTTNKEKVDGYDKAITDLNEVIDFEDITSLVDAVTDLKKDNDEKTEALKSGKSQLQEIFNAMPELYETDSPIPLSNSKLKNIVEYISTINSSANEYKKCEQFLRIQAKKFGFEKTDINEVLRFISSLLNKSQETTNQE